MSEDVVNNQCQKAINNLSIYDKDETNSTSTVSIVNSNRVLFRGIGQYGVALLEQGVTTKSLLTNEIKSLKHYALSTEGKVKLSAIAICTAGFGIYGLLTTKTRFKRIGYSLCGLALSSAVCYPRNSYRFAKISASKGYEYSQTGWAHTKNGYDIFYDKYLAKPEEEPEEKILEEDSDAKDVATLMNVPNTFEIKEEPLAVITSHSLLHVDEKVDETAECEEQTIFKDTPIKVEVSSSEKDNLKSDGTSIDPEETNKKDEFESNSNMDVGQSIPSDKELYTTRS